jgi:DNA-binding FadR family transcriptional regulator
MTITHRSQSSRRRGLHRDVVDALGSRIVQGELSSGMSLPNEVELSLALDVSRTVVRETIKVLAAKGLAESRPKTGTRVMSRSHWSLIDPDVLSWQLDAGVGEDFFRDVMEVRSFIEPRAAGLAAIRRTDEEATHLEELLEEMVRTVDHPYAEAYVDVDLELHAAILHATHNEMLAQMTSTLGTALQAGRTVTTRVPGGHVQAMPLHRAVVAAIVAGDSPGAVTAMDRLVKSAAHDIEVILHGGDDNDSDGSA